MFKGALWGPQPGHYGQLVEHEILVVSDGEVFEDLLHVHFFYNGFWACLLIWQVMT